MSNQPNDPRVQGDDRNLVAVNEGYQGASFEDRLFLFWSKYRNLILLLIVAGFLFIIGREAYRYVAAQREASIRSDFAAVQEPSGFRAFARANQNHPLGGLAFLNAGDAAYNEGAYGQAVTDYDAAASALEQPELAARARLGAAMARIQSGQVEAGERQLTVLADDDRVVQPLRAEALFRLATIAIQAGEPAAAEVHLTRILEIDPAGFWSSRATSLRGTLPQPEVD
jgi:hypothetical protein